MTSQTGKTSQTLAEKPEKRRRRKLAIIAGALVLLGGGAAFAYWTVTGSGTGTAETAGTVDVVVNQDAIATEIGPGVTAQPLAGDFDNPNASTVTVDTMTVVIDSIAGGGPTCEATDYTLDDTLTVDAGNLTFGSGVGAWSGGSIAFNNKAGEDQNDCKGATVNLAYTVS